MQDLAVLWVHRCSIDTWKRNVSTQRVTKIQVKNGVQFFSPSRYARCADSPRPSPCTSPPQVPPASCWYSPKSFLFWCCTRTKVFQADAHAPENQKKTLWLIGGAAGAFLWAPCTRTSQLFFSPCRGRTLHCFILKLLHVGTGAWVLVIMMLLTLDRCRLPVWTQRQVELHNYDVGIQ